MTALVYKGDFILKLDSLLIFIGKLTVIFRRYLELLIIEVLLSAAIALLHDSKLITEFSFFTIFVCTFFVIFLIVNVRQTRHCYFDLRNKPWHYTLNIISCILFAATTYAIYKFTPYEVYRMTMSLTNVFKYIYLPCPIPVSAMLFHATTFVVTILAPIGMDKIIEIILWEEDECIDE